MQKLIITAEIVLPDDIFDQAAILGRMKTARDAFSDEIGENGNITTRVVTVRVPVPQTAAPRNRKKKGDNADG